jgi:hypothetical protein
MRQKLDERLREFKLHKRNLCFLFAFPLTTSGTGNLQPEVINLQWRSNLNQSFAQTKFPDCCLYLQNGKEKKPEDSSPHSQAPATRPYPKPALYNP